MTDRDEPRLVRVSFQEYALLRAMLFDGATNRVIGKRLFVCEDTVKTHLKHVYVKCGIHDRLALAIAVMSGAIEIIHVPAVGPERHLRDDLQQLHAVRRNEEEECPTSSVSPLATASPPPSRSSI